MYASTTCCVPGCLVTKKDGVTLHCFPNPATEAERYNTWISKIGGDIATSDSVNIFHNKRVCHKHFEDIYKYNFTNRLTKVAIPGLYLPAPPITESKIIEPSKSDVQETKSDNMRLSDHLLQSIYQVSPLQSTGCHKFVPKCAITQVVRTESIITSPTPPPILDDEENKSNIMKTDPCNCLVYKKRYNSILMRLKKVKQAKMALKRKYLLAKSMTKSRAFDIVTSKMSKTAKLFCQMQAFQSEKIRGRRFTHDQKLLALSLYKPSPEAYRVLSKICVMPSAKTLQSLMQKIN